MPVGLIALALGGFGIGLTEFVIMGLLPDVAADFGVSEADGRLVHLRLRARRGGGRPGIDGGRDHGFERKPVLAGLLVLFIAGNLLSAIAPDYWPMMLGRIIAALAHGAFFGIGAVVAAGMVAAHQEGRCHRPDVHRAHGGQRPGRSVRHAAGPGCWLAGHLLGHHRDRRARRWPASWRWFPGRPAQAEAGGACAAELRAFRSGQVWLSILVTILGYGGMFGAFTYIAYTLTEVSGFAASTVPWLLIVFGVGLFVGNTVGGKAADRNVDRTLLVVLAVLAVVLVAFALTAGNQPC